MHAHALASVIECKDCPALSHSYPLNHAYISKYGYLTNAHTQIVSWILASFRYHMPWVLYFIFKRYLIICNYLLVASVSELHFLSQQPQFICEDEFGVYVLRLKICINGYTYFKWWRYKKWGRIFLRQKFESV